MLQDQELAGVPLQLVQLVARHDHGGERGDRGKDAPYRGARDGVKARKAISLAQKAKLLASAKIWLIIGTAFYAMAFIGNLFG